MFYLIENSDGRIFNSKVCRHNFFNRFCDGNGRAANREYQRRLPERERPNYQTFGSMFNFYLKQNGTFPQLKSERPLDHLQENQIIDADEADLKIIKQTIFLPPLSHLKCPTIASRR